MNRLKLWVYTLLVVGSGGAGLYLGSVRLAERATEQLDHQLRAAAALLEARTRVLGAQVADAALSAVRDPAVAAVLAPPPAEAPRGRRGRAPPPPPRPQPAEALPHVEAAVRAAAEAAGFNPSGGLVAGLATESGLALRSAGREVRPDKDAGGAAATLSEATGGARRDALLLVDQSPFYAVGLPAGNKVAVIAGLPIDGRWADSIRAGSGADVTLVAELKRQVSTLSPTELKATLAAVRRPSARPVAVGDLGPISSSLPLPPMPYLFAPLPAFQAQGVALPGITAVAAVSVPTRPLFAPLAAGQQVAVAGLAVLLLLGLVLGLFASEVSGPPIPKDLLAAADRISAGDFETRAPALPGRLGRLARALNFAAEAAASAGGPAPEEAGLAPAGLPLAPLDLPPVPPPPEAGDSESGAGRGEVPEFFAASLRPAAAPEVSTTGRLDGGDLFAAPAAAPPRVAPARDSAPAAPVAAAPAPRQEPPPRPPTPAPIDDEAHWQQVFEEFLRTRQQCGEPSEGLTFDKFREKLRKNRESLIQKYACKAVRFQVYVKEGKAALKATPVR